MKAELLCKPPVSVSEVLYRSHLMQKVKESCAC